jgi:hypothetical protein
MRPKSRKVRKISKLKKRGGSKTKKFVQLRCSPKPIGQTKKSKTCYTNDHLLRLKSAWNARNPNNPISATNLDTVWNELKNKFSNVCDRESCWYKQFAKTNHFEHELNRLFAPVSPNKWKTNPNEWLSTTDIVKVMNQYTKIYKCFEFIGPSPIDYDTMETDHECVWDELCHFNLQAQIDKGKTKIGVIFNTDPHTKGGSHWISLFINIKKGLVFFFDSAGDKIPPNIHKFVRAVIDQGKHLVMPITFKFDQNYPNEHQYKNTECGMYSLYFIIHMLEDKVTSEYLKTHVLTDKYIEKFRKIYYNDEL